MYYKIYIAYLNLQVITAIRGYYCFEINFKIVGEIDIWNLKKRKSGYFCSIFLLFAFMEGGSRQFHDTLR